jgi:hypothetical protein
MRETVSLRESMLRLLCEVFGPAILVATFVVFTRWSDLSDPEEKMTRSTETLALVWSQDVRDGGAEWAIVVWRDTMGGLSEDA